MNNEPIEKEETETSGESSLADNISGVGQMIIGGIERIGGIITGDPTTRAEGIYNTVTGEERSEIENELEEGAENHEEK